MRYEDLTVRQQRLLSSSICPICHKPIERIEDMQLLQMRYGRRVLNFYIHSACLLESLMSSQLGGNKDEEIEKATI